MVKIIDAIMGSGKTQATISYINDHPESKFVYITPYLSEAKRIFDGCTDTEFVEPCDDLRAFSFSKLEHTRSLLRAGKNVATSHVAFRSYTRDMIESIRNYGYTLIVDEAVEVFRSSEFTDGDVKLLIDGGYLEEKNEGLIYTGKPYTGSRLSDLFNMLRCNNLLRVKSGTGKTALYYYWALPEDILRAFSDVYVLTYLFESSDLKYYLDMRKISYCYAGIHKEGDRYTYADSPDYIPNYVKKLSQMIEIHDNDKMNRVGGHKNALSLTWMKKHKEEREVLKKHIHNYFQSYCKARSKNVMWSTFKDCYEDLRGKGYSTQFTPFNMKSKNEYRDRTALAYCVNIFIKPGKKNFFIDNGIDFDEDGFALSTMIQWIWRSAIRDGQKIKMYVPSNRMRTLLKNWMVEAEQNYIHNKENRIQ